MNCITDFLPDDTSEHNANGENMDEIVFGVQTAPETLTPSELDAAIYDEKPVLPGDNMSVRQLLEAIAEGLTGDYSASAVACLALEKLNPQGFTAVIDPLAVDTEGAYMNPQSAAEHWKALHESSIEAHAETLERVKALEAENARLRAALENIAHCPVSSGEYGYMVMLYEARRALGIPTPYDNLTDDDIGEDGL